MTFPTRRTPDPIVRSWNRKIAEGDAYLIVTAEYNHSVPGQLKNAIDSVFASFGFRNKPVAFVGYSGGIAAGTRAVEHLALIFIEAEAVPLRNTVLIPFVAEAFDEAGKPKNAASDIALGITLDDLSWFLERAWTGPRRRRARARHTQGPRGGGCREQRLTERAAAITPVDAEPTRCSAALAPARTPTRESPKASTSTGDEILGVHEATFGGAYGSAHPARARS